MKKDLSIYIHIPFCDHKCIYCDFYSVITLEKVDSYLKNLLTEINFWAEKYKEQFEVKTIFFGGGTPSFMSPEYLGEILSEIKTKFFVSNDCEITMETNPGTVDKAKMIGFKAAGINRVSIGVQSFQPDELKFLTRIHDRKQAETTVLNTVEAGIENISIDLIFNLPGQTKSQWRRNLEAALSLPIKHISPYSLILERGTILNKMVLDGKVELQDADYDADLYDLTIDFLSKNGFEQYEVSNFCLPGYKCNHNLAYWRYKEYLSFGTSGHSFIGNKRWWNFSALTFYEQAVQTKGFAVSGEEELTEKQMEDEFIMLMLRSEGLDPDQLKKRFNSLWFEQNKVFLDELISNGFLAGENNFIKFTPKGYAVCDEILSKMY
ncbi:MAG: radical SAM family heme chaperone HemW [Melioribacteraceae bacterium]|nr:radical SAM family heme chaperone HemW [Melioribacteraceae bacterium]MCF8265115.1 radical SAM family heme chaperone HemW [Melioribacteraceae bacterium]MCF8413588.1 radical SAM family heme chaperone HemW [Melioribacteraceae bacterium]